MAKYIDHSLEDGISKQIDEAVFEAVDLGIRPLDIKKLVEESIAWAVKELDKEHFEA